LTFDVSLYTYEANVTEKRFVHVSSFYPTGFLFRLFRENMRHGMDEAQRIHPQEYPYDIDV